MTMGATGPTGPIGLTGATGPVGATGPTGASGLSFVISKTYNSEAELLAATGGNLPADGEFGLVQGSTSSADYGKLYLRSGGSWAYRADISVNGLVGPTGPSGSASNGYDINLSFPGAPKGGEILHKFIAARPFQLSSTATDHVLEIADKVISSKKYKGGAYGAKDFIISKNGTVVGTFRPRYCQKAYSSVNFGSDNGENRIAITQDGSKIVACSRDEDSVIFINVNTLAVTSVSNTKPELVKITPDGTKAVVISRPYTVSGGVSVTWGNITARVYSLSNFSLLCTVVTNISASNYALFDVSNSKAYFTSVGGQIVKQINLSTNTAGSDINIGSNISSMKLNPSLTRLYVYSSGPSLKYVDLSNDSVNSVSTSGSMLSSLETIKFSSDGDNLYGAAAIGIHYTRYIQKINLLNGQASNFQAGNGQGGSFICILQDNLYAIVGGSSTYFGVLKINLSQNSYTSLGSCESSNRLILSSDGSKVYSAISEINLNNSLSKRLFELNATDIANDYVRDIDMSSNEVIAQYVYGSGINIFFPSKITITNPSAYSFAAGDVLTITAPEMQDPILSDMYLTLKGEIV